MSHQLCSALSTTRVSSGGGGGGGGGGGSFPLKRKREGKRKGEREIGERWGEHIFGYYDIHISNISLELSN